MTPDGPVYNLTDEGPRTTWTYRRKIRPRKYLTSDWHVVVEWSLVAGTLTPTGLIVRAADGATALSRTVVQAMPVGRLIEESRQVEGAFLRLMAKHETGDLGRAAREIQAAMTKDVAGVLGLPVGVARRQLTRARDMGLLTEGKRR